MTENDENDIFDPTCSREKCMLCQQVFRAGMFENVHIKHVTRARKKLMDINRGHDDPAIVQGLNRYLSTVEDLHIPYGMICTFCAQFIPSCKSLHKAANDLELRRKFGPRSTTPHSNNSGMSIIVQHPVPHAPSKSPRRGDLRRESVISSTGSDFSPLEEYQVTGAMRQLRLMNSPNDIKRVLSIECVDQGPGLVAPSAHRAGRKSSSRMLSLGSMASLKGDGDNSREFSQLLFENLKQKERNTSKQIISTSRTRYKKIIRTIQHERLQREAAKELESTAELECMSQSCLSTNNSTRGKNPRGGRNKGKSKAGSNATKVVCRKFGRSHRQELIILPKL